LKRLKLKLEQVVAYDGVEVDDGLSEDLQLVIDEMILTILKVSKINLSKFFGNNRCDVTIISLSCNYFICFKL